MLKKSVTPLFLLLLLLASVCLAAELPPYKATVAANMPGMKLSVDCVLQKPVDEETLRALGARVFEENNGAAYERVFIMWYLPHYKIGAGAWGVTNYAKNKPAEVRIWALQG